MKITSTSRHLRWIALAICIALFGSTAATHAAVLAYDDLEDAVLQVVIGDDAGLGGCRKGEKDEGGRPGFHPQDAADCCRRNGFHFDLLHRGLDGSEPLENNLLQLLRNFIPTLGTPMQAENSAGVTGAAILNRAASSLQRRARRARPTLKTAQNGGYTWSGAISERTVFIVLSHIENCRDGGVRQQSRRAQASGVRSQESHTAVPIHEAGEQVATERFNGGISDSVGLFVGV